MNTRKELGSSFGIQKYLGFLPLLLAISLCAAFSAAAQCSLSLENLRVSGDYAHSGGTYVTASVYVRWDNEPAGEVINVRLLDSGGAPVDQRQIQMTYEPSPGKPRDMPNLQEIAFEVSADGTPGYQITAEFSGGTCSATPQSFDAPVGYVSPVGGASDLGGVVFKDFDMDGVRSAGETVSLANVTVKATDSTGAVWVQQTDKYGRYLLGVPPANYPLRVEFGDIPEVPFLSTSTPSGSSSATTVQFVSAPRLDVDLGVANPAEFSQLNPDIVTTCFINGDPDPANASGGETNPSMNGDTIVSFSYAMSGDKDMANMQPLALAGETGSVWGVAWDRYQQRIFTSAFLRRYVGIGSLGLGGIYVDNYTADSDGLPGAPGVDGWDASSTDGASFDLLALTDTDGTPIDLGTIASNAARGLSTEATDPTHDIDAFSKVGKIGMGDIDIAEDGSSLWVTNLFEKTIVKVALPADGSAPTEATSFAIDTSLVTCVDGEMRPWALRVYEGKIYCGVVCTAENGGRIEDLVAAVLRFNPVTRVWANVMEFPLSYPKGYSFRARAELNGWYPWEDDFSQWGNSRVHPQPMFTDIEFDVDGSMVLGFADRGGFQMGFQNYPPVASSTQLINYFTAGDILRTANTGDGNFLLENNARVAGVVGFGAGNNQGPGLGEFYADNFNATHTENAVGGLALRPGSGEVVATMMDAFSLRTNGIRWLDNTAGTANNNFSVFDSDPGNSGFDPGTFNKANGLGDLELVSQLPEILEIGNRVWSDTNGDGVQDPAEVPLADVAIILYDSTGSVVATETTATDGSYYFDTVDGLEPETSYYIVVDPSEFDTGGDLDGLFPTVPFSSSAIIDSNAVTLASANDASLPPALEGLVGTGVVTGRLMENDHSIDLGFGGNPAPLTVGDRVWLDSNENGQQDPGEPGVAGVAVVLEDSSGIQVNSAVTNGDGNYLFSSDSSGNPLPAGNYSIEFAAPAGYLFTIADAGADSSDSDALAGGGTVSFALASNSMDLTRDAGLLPNLSLGSTVFNDSNDNGIQDSGEGGFAGVDLELYDSNDILVATATTVGSGDYLFANLEAGNYYVVVPLPPASAPASSTGAATSDDDIDGDDNGQQASSGSPAFSALIELAAGTESTSETFQGGTQDDSSDADGNMTVDFGFVGVAAPLNPSIALSCIEITAIDAAVGTVDMSVTVDFTDSVGTELTFAVAGQTFTRTIAGPAGSSGTEVFTLTGVVGTASSAQVFFTTAPTGATDTATFSEGADGFTCRDYIYLNEVSNGGQVHKFSVATNGTLTEIGSPWSTEAGSAPHGLAIDRNGFLYIGETRFGPLRRLNADGTVIPTSDFEVEFTDPGALTGYNFGSIGNTVYIHQSGSGNSATSKVVGYDACTGDVVHEVVLQSPNSEFNWGFHIDKWTKKMYATRRNGEVWIFDQSDFGGPPLAPSFTAPATISSGNPSNTTGLNGVATDPQGNIYLADTGLPSRILKYDGAGNLLATSAGDTNNGDGGYALIIGLVYSETSGTLYSSNFTLDDDCVSEFDTDLNYLGEAVPPPAGQDVRGKAIELVSECCPPAEFVTISANVCYGGAPLEFSLQELLGVEGFVVEGQWAETQPDPAFAYDDCELTVTVSGLGCAQYTLSSDGTGTNFQCGEFKILLNICAVPCDFGDLADTAGGTSSGNYQTTQADGGASHIIVADLLIGSTVDADDGSQQNSAASADGADEDGVTLPGLIYTGDTAIFGVQATNDVTGGDDANLCVFVDWNNDGDFEDMGENASVSVPNSSGGSNRYALSFTVPANAATETDLGVRVRLTTDDCAANGAASDGEVEDYLVTVNNRYDYGDLPEGGSKDYPTAGANAFDRARHLLGSGLALGSNVDAEEDGQPNTSATGDGSDEDGFEVLPDFMPGVTYRVPFSATVPVSVSDPVLLNAWIDFDCSGSFDTGEQIATDLVVVDGTNAVTFTVPPGATPGVAYSRFRLSTESGLSAVGDAADGEVEDYLVTILSPIGAIGNYIWLDEDSDGQQNPGEPGIANVMVQLFLDEDEGGPNAPVLIETATTDTNGGYLFSNLAAGCYYVDIVDSSVSSTLTQTSFYTNVTDSDSDTAFDEGDFGNKDHSGNGYKIALAPNEVNRTADFGYNQNPTADVNGGENTAALGDKVWFDSDEDGKKDSNEVGIAGVTLEIFTAGPDNLFGTADDVSGGTQTTNATGCYLFDGLAPNAYIVRVTDTAGALTGFAQTGDPDHFGTTGANNDGVTTAPVVLGPGDVFLNADFGYYADKTLFGTIGDKIWLDADASGGDETTKGAEAGIAGVTVALIGDTNKDGVINSDEIVIASDTTDASGCYLFEGLPVDADGEGYIVWVNDTGNALSGLEQTYDENGALDGTSSAVLDETTLVSLAEDFSYTSRTPVGSIGDTIWANLDSSIGNQATQGDEPGLNNVTVNLCDSGGNVIATTTTDSNGNYLFSNLPFGSYVVKVDETALGGAVGTTPSYDPDGGADSESIVTIDAATPHNRDQDFSYPPAAGNLLASIGDKVYYDYDGSGLQNGSEPGIYGVTVQLTPPAGVDLGEGAGNPIATTTDDKGCYLFSNLPSDAAAYTVTVLTPPVGTTQTQDPESAVDNSSQEVLAASEHNRAQDFGYQPAATLYSIGNSIWFDANGDGVKSDDPNEDPAGSEEGIPGVRVTLCNDGPDGILGNADDEIVAITTTDASGLYLFTGLPTGDYRVKIDPATLPAGVSPLSTFERDSTTDNYSDVLALTADITTEDFAYPPLGAIGDTVFFDLNDNDQPDTGEGLAEVVVLLCSSDGLTILAQTTTDSNGRYLFDDLSAGSYRVKVDPNGDTLPIGLINTEDPDTDPDTQAIPGDEFSVVTIGAGETNLDQDFGYQENGGASLGNLVWLDLNADGIYQSATETPIGGVTVDLIYDANRNGFADPGEPIFGSTITDSAIDSAYGTDGNYCFDNLPDGDYVVEVSDRDGILDGYWHSLGTADANNNSQPEAFGLTLNGTDQKNADFGYYIDPAKVGNYVWFDQDGDGVQDAIETGLDGVKVTLTITYPNADTIVLNTLTGDDPSTVGVTEAGWYNFCNLLLDEDYRGAGGGTEPAYAITVETPAGYSATQTDATTDKQDSDPSGVASQPIQGSENVAQNADPNAEQTIASYDFGFEFTKRNTFAEWQAENAGLSDTTPGGDPDMDGRSNLEEFAFCLKADSGLNGTAVNGGSSTYAGFCIESDGTDISGSFLRPEGVTGLTYTLQRTATLAMPTNWTTSSILLDGTNTTVTSQGDGTELVTIADIETLAALTGGAGNVRLLITLDSPTETATTKPQGWKTRAVTANCETFAYPFEDKQLYGGKGSSLMGSALTLDPTTLAAGDDVGAALRFTGAQYYIEVTGGDNIGHRIDIDETNSTANVLALLADADPCSAQGDLNSSTSGAVPADLVGDAFVIRRFHTIDELFPAADYTAGGDVDAAANLLFFDPGAQAFVTYFLLNDGTNPIQWVAMGDTPSLTGPGRGAEIIPPGRGLFTHNKAPASTFDLLEIGTIRCNPTVQPLKAGYNLLGATYPVATSPSTLGLTAANGFTGTEDPDTADQALTWLGDATPEATGYTGLFYLIHDDGTNPAIDQWNGVSDSVLTNVSGDALLHCDRSIILDIRTAKPAYTTPVPFN